MIYIRSTLANIGVYGCLLFGCVVSSAMGLFSRKSTIYFWNYFMIPVTMFVLRLTAGIKIEIRGRQHLRHSLHGLCAESAAGHVLPHSGLFI